MKVAFHVSQFSLRGTEVATYDYARGLEKHLGGKAVIVAPLWNRRHRWAAYRRFRTAFPVHFYRRPEDLGPLVRSLGTDAFYALKGGPDERRVEGVRNLVHGVFRSCPPHGDRFAYISPFLSRVCPGDHPWVPHIIDLPPVPEDRRLRRELGIPADGVVFGRHGGEKTFDLDFVHQTVYEVLEQRPEAWFLFLGTRRFGPKHPRLIHLKGTPEIEPKLRFIDACDAMLHARRDGETFGLAIGEFSARNRPVFTWGGSEDAAHLEFLGEKGIVYQAADDLREKLLAFLSSSGEPLTPHPSPPRRGELGDRWDVYSERFAPAVVMRRFAEVFLD